VFSATGDSLGLRVTVSSSKGLRVFADGKEIAKSAELARVTGKL
jgi:hypothetical protein